MTTALAERCQQIIAATDAHKRDQIAARVYGPTIRLWDGHFNLVEHMRCEDSFSFTEIENGTGTGSLVLDGELDIAQHMWDMKARKDSGETIDMFVTVDYVGTRWSGRLDDTVLRADELGNPVIETIWEHDYEQLKARDLWATPSTPAGFQPIKVFALGGPTDWALGSALWVNFARAHGNPIGWSGDPLANKTADYRNWPIVIEPNSYAEAKARGTNTGVVLSRFKTWHEAAEAMLEDAELTVRLRRYLPGDELPWEGARISYGTLVVSFEYNSGGLSGGVTGSLASGIDQMVRIWLSALVEGMGGGSLPIEEGEQAATGQPIPPAYQQPGYLGSDPGRPYVLYTKDSPGLVGVEAHLKGAKYRRLTSGGHSAPMVNELLEAAVAAIGDALAMIPTVPPLGGVANALLRPFYTDVILAFMTVYLVNRAGYTSPFGLYERFLAGADKAYTLSSTLVMRAGMRATESQFSAQFRIIDGAPWWMGDKGLGDMHLGTRILMQLPGDNSGRIYSERIRKTVLSGSRGKKPDWDLVLGDLAPAEDALVKVMRQVEKVTSGLKQSGLL